MKKILFFAVLVCIALIACQSPSQQTTVMKEGNVVVDNILSRRSIRVYQPNQIKQTELDTIIRCAVGAPSALNKQSWEVRIIQNQDLLDRINRHFVEKAKGKNLPGSASRAQEPGFSVFHGAPTLIIVGYDTVNPYSQVDCGLLAQNVLLSAESMDIGTCVIGNMAGLLNDADSKHFLEEIKLPETHKVAFGIAVGYKGEEPAAKSRDLHKVQIIK